MFPPSYKIPETFKIPSSYSIGGGAPPSWSYRKSHIINGSTAGAQTNYQIRIVVHYGAGTDSGEDVYLNGKCRTDFGDIRFRDADGVTELSYWMEKYVASDYAIFWVKVPSIPLSPGTTTIYIYYGNPSATTTSSGVNTFIFFDDFINLNNWNLYGTTLPTIDANGWLRTSSTSGGTSYCQSKITIPSSYYRIRFKFYSPSGAYWRGHFYYYDNANKSNQIYWWLPADSGAELALGTQYSGTGDGGRVACNIATQHQAEILVYPTSYIKFLLDGSVVRTSTTAGAMIPADGRAIRLEFGDDTADTGYGDIRWDVLTIGKYVDPEPSHGAWGSEESL